MAVFNKEGLVVPWSHSIEYDKKGKFFRIIDSGSVALFYLKTKTQSDWYDNVQTGWSRFLSPVKKDGLWGFIDIRDGKLAVPCRYYEVKMFDSYGIAKVKVKDDFFSFSNWISIDTNGKTVEKQQRQSVQ